MDSVVEQDEGATEELEISTVSGNSRNSTSFQNEVFEDSRTEKPLVEPSYSHLNFPDLDIPEVTPDDSWDETVGESFEDTFSEKILQPKQLFSKTAKEIEYWYFKSLMMQEIIKNI